MIMLTGRASVVERLTEVIQRVDHAGNRTEEVIPLDNARLRKSPACWKA